MTTTKIHNLIVFGDSMSDIGNKRGEMSGLVARVLGLMRTNDVGRFSDSKNWTDFLWEWAGGSPLVHKSQDQSNRDSASHRSLSLDAASPFYYVNYAAGGAMGASDRPATGLGTFKEQVALYRAERKKHGLHDGATLHILWFGLNDLVTNRRPPTEMDAVVDEMGARMGDITGDFGAREEHFLVIELPTPAGSIRFMKENDVKVAAEADKGAQLFNKSLRKLCNGTYFRDSDQVTIVAMYEWLAGINDEVAKTRKSNVANKYGLVGNAQPKGAPVNYGTAEDTYLYRNCVATSDDAHPTEAVYKLIAKEVARTLLQKYDLGTLREKLPK
jgi:phospholipase/lecithinase/hemolysin